MKNVCNFIGRLGADPEMKRMNNGDSVANLSLAVSERWRDKDGNRQERTEWVKLVCFSDGLCRVIESYLKKGSLIDVTGKMKTRKYQTQDGQDRYSTEIVIDKLVMLDGKDNRDNSGGNYGAASGGEYVGDNGLRQGGMQNDTDDIPF
jgi:single-strand DNA-binding protein